MDHVAAKDKTERYSVLPFRLTTADNPAGTERAALDKTARALDEDRPKFLVGVCRIWNA